MTNNGKLKYIMTHRLATNSVLFIPDDLDIMVRKVKTLCGIVLGPLCGDKGGCAELNGERDGGGKRGGGGYDEEKHIIEKDAGRVFILHRLYIICQKLVRF